MAAPTVIPAKQLYRTATKKAELARALSKRESGWCIEDSTLYIKKEDDSLAPVVPAQDLVDIEKERAIAAETAEKDARTDADAEISTSLEEEKKARHANDELLQQQIEDVAVQIEAVAVQTDWAQDDAMAIDYLKNKPTTITDAEIAALFI